MIIEYIVMRRWRRRIEVKSLRRALIFGVLVLLSVSRLAGEDRLFLLRGAKLHVLDALDGRKLAERDSAGGDIIAGTPGGKYVFVLNSATGMGEAVDFENPKLVKAVDLSAGAPLAGVRFSPMGDVLYGVSADSNRITSYRHQAGEVSDPVGFDLPSAGGLGGLPAMNSRGTRLYRGGSGDLTYYLVADWGILKSVPETAGIFDWVTAPGGRFLWGTHQNGWTVVDEPKARIVEVFPASGGRPPRFDPDGRTAWALADKGRSLWVLDVRRRRILNQIGLPGSSYGPAPDGTGGVWIAGESSLLHYGLEDGVLENRGELPGAGPVFAFESIRLKPGQGFACF